MSPDRSKPTSGYSPAKRKRGRPPLPPEERIRRARARRVKELDARKRVRAKYEPA